MESNRLYLPLLIFLAVLFSSPLLGQTEFSAVERAKYDGKYLRVTFVNCSDKNLLAPDLTKRRGNDEPNLYKEYYHITGDTIEITLTTEVSPSLYEIVNREGGPTSGKVVYTDVLLKPGKRYKSKSRLMLPDSVSVLKMGGYILPICR